jgi:hypothetical protein
LWFKVNASRCFGQHLGEPPSESLGQPLSEPRTAEVTAPENLTESVASENRKTSETTGRLEVIMHSLNYQKLLH